MLGGIDGLLQFYLERYAVHVYLCDVAFYFFNLYFVVDTLYFILILVQLCILLFDDLLFTISYTWNCVIWWNSSFQGDEDFCLMVMIPDSTS